MAYVPWIVRFGLLALLCVTPWLFAGILFVHQAWILGAVALVVLLDLIWRPFDRDSAAVPWSILPLVLGLLLNWAQLLPLGGAADFLAPTASALRVENGAGERIDIQHPVTTRSLYPELTREHLGLLALAVGAFWLAARHLSDRESAPWLLGVLGGLGGILAFFAIAQRLSWNGMIYWTIPMSTPGNPFGPFVNENNAGGFLNICLAGAAGWLVQLSRMKPDAGRKPKPRSFGSSKIGSGRQPTHYVQYQRSNQWDKTVQGLSQLTPLQSTALIATGFILAGVACSQSRGSIVAMIAGVLVAACVLATTPGSSRSIFSIVLIVLVGLGLMSWVGQTDAVQEELATLMDESTYEGGRALNWPDALEQTGRFWSWGSGLGTYRYVYALSQQWFSGDRWFYYAENQFLQSLLEGGIFALLLLLAEIALIGWASVRLVQIEDTTSFALGLAGILALATQAIGGAFDFGLYMPANILAMATLCGAVAGRAARRTDQEEEETTTGLLMSQSSGVTLVCTTIILASAVFGLPAIRRAGRVEQIERAVPLTQLREQREPSQSLDQAITDLTAALQSRPGDAEGHRHLAEMWIQKYHIATFQELKPVDLSGTGDPVPRLESDLSAAAGVGERVTDDDSSERSPEEIEAELNEVWDRCGVWQLHYALRQMEMQGDEGKADGLRQQPTVQKFLQPAWQHLLQSRGICPLISHVHYELAELTPAVDPDGDDTLHIARAEKLAPGDATLHFWSGILHWNSRRDEQAMGAWKQSLDLSEMHTRQIVDLMLQRRSVSEIQELMPDDPEVLIQVVNSPALADDEAARMVLYERIVKLYEKNDEDLTASETYAVATALLKLDRPTDAVIYMERAVSGNPKAHHWRYQYAQLLHRLRFFDDARDHALRLTREKQFNRSYQQLYKQILRDQAAQ